MLLWVLILALGIVSILVGRFAVRVYRKALRFEEELLDKKKTIWLLEESLRNLKQQNNHLRSSVSEYFKRVQAAKKELNT